MVEIVKAYNGNGQGDLHTAEAATKESRLIFIAHIAITSCVKTALWPTKNWKRLAVTMLKKLEASYPAMYRITLENLTFVTNTGMK